MLSRARSLLAVLAIPLVLFASVSPSRAQSLCHSANDTPNYEDLSSTGNAWFGIQFTAPASFTANRIELFTGETTAASALDIWTHDPQTTLPGMALSSDPFTIQPPNGWQGANLSSPVPLTANQDYWIVWHAVLGAQASRDQPGSVNGPAWCVSTTQGQSWIGPAQSTDRQWKFRIYGNCCAQASTYCTAGTTANGCNATLTFSGAASASAPSGFTVTANNVEGQRQGLFFYGVTGPLAQPWGTGSSFLCVKTPTQRTQVQPSNGSFNACDGQLSIDWNAFITANPGALGQPFAAGDSVWLQAWFRDPPSPKTTSLSDALEFSLCP
jgi:hypothetical protein